MARRVRFQRKSCRLSRPPSRSGRTLAPRSSASHPASSDSRCSSSRLGYWSRDQWTHDGQEVVPAQARRATGAGAVGQAGEAPGQEALDGLPNRLGMVAEGAGGGRDGGAVADGADHQQPLMHPVLGRAGAQATLQLVALGSGQDDAQRGLHGGGPFRSPP